MTVKAMYPGTFDPMTLGHRELAIRAQILKKIQCFHWKKESIWPSLS